jgi:hypothetical protein
MRLWSPSRLDSLAVCPRYIQVEYKPDENEDANEGIRLHECAESCLRDGVDPLSLGLSTEQENALLAALEKVNEYRATGATILQFEQELKCSVAGRGFADVLMTTQDQTFAVVADYKFIRTEGTHDWQLKAYATAVMEMLPAVRTVTTVAIIPRLQQYPEATYHRDQLPRLQQELRELQERVENPYTPGCVGDRCPSCKWNGQCPAQNASLVPISEAIAAPVTQQQLQDPQTPEDWARVLALGDWIVDWYTDKDTGVKRKATALVAAGMQIPGYKLVQRRGASSLRREDMVTVMQRLRGIGLSESEILGACRLSVSALVDLACETSGAKKTEMATLVGTALKDLRVEGAPVQYIQRTKYRERRELTA